MWRRLGGFAILAVLSVGILEGWSLTHRNTDAGPSTAASCDLLSVDTLAGLAGPGTRDTSKTFRDLPEAVDCTYQGSGGGLNYIVWRPALVSFGTAVQRAQVDLAADLVVRTSVHGTSDARLVSGDYHGLPFAEIVAEQGKTFYTAGATTESSAKSERMARSLMASLLVASPPAG